MKYPPELVDRLAAGYVLGSLHGRARQRFATLLHQRADARLAVWRWERHLSILAAGVRPVKPPRRIWRQVQRRISESPQRWAPGFASAIRRRLTVRWAPALAAVFFAMVAVWAVLDTPQPFEADRLAVFAAEDSAALWVVNADLDNGELVAQAVTPPTGDDTTDYELWVLPPTGHPRSMGLLATTPGTQQRLLSQAALAVLPRSSTLAISIEPKGGSPTGLPTGPVVYQAELVRL